MVILLKIHGYSFEDTVQHGYSFENFVKMGSIFTQLRPGHRLQEKMEKRFKKSGVHVPVLIVKNGSPKFSKKKHVADTGGSENK